MNIILMAPAGSGKSHLAKMHPDSFIDGDEVIANSVGWPPIDDWYKQDWAVYVHAANYFLLAGRSERRITLFVGAVNIEWFNQCPSKLILAPCDPILVWDRAREDVGKGKRSYPTNLEDARAAHQAILDLAEMPGSVLLSEEFSNALFNLKKG